MLMGGLGAGAESPPPALLAAGRPRLWDEPQPGISTGGVLGASHTVTSASEEATRRV